MAQSFYSRAATVVATSDGTVWALVSLLTPSLLYPQENVSILHVPLKPDQVISN